MQNPADSGALEECTTAFTGPHEMSIHVSFRGAWLIDPAGVAPRLSLLEVPEPKTAKSRLHMDLGERTPDERLERVPPRANSLRGDHLGPSPWRRLPAEQAMEEAAK